MFNNEQVNDGNNLVTGENLLILASSVMVAAGYDVLIAQPFVALSYPIFIVILLFTVYGNTKTVLDKKFNIGWFLLFPLLALVMTRLLFANDVLRSINSIAVPVLFMAHILLVTKNNRHEWFCFGFLKDIGGGLIVRPLRQIFVPLFLLRGLARLEGEVSNCSVSRKVLIGIIFSLPLLVIVIMLLSSADQVFDYFISSFIATISFAEVIKHTIIIGSVTMLAFSFIRGLNNKKAETIPCKPGAKRLDEIIVISFLSVLSLLYLLFSVIQFSYLFGGYFNHLHSGLTYADYARRGFFELVAVAVLNTILVVGNLNFTALNGRKSATALKLLNSVLLLSTFVMLASAHFRMSLYEESYGYTYLRVFTHCFMAMLFVMLCTTVYRVWAGGISLVKWYIVIGLMAYVLVNYANVDTFIARKNLERYYRTGIIDINYVAELSCDTLPYWGTLAKDPDYKIAKAARLHITCMQYRLASHDTWQGFNLAEQRARTSLRENM